MYSGGVGVVINLGTGFVIDGDADETTSETEDQDEFSDIESVRLTGSISGTTVIGDGKANCLIGSSADDTIRGEGGNDFVYGGGGTDTLSGGAGNDTLVTDAALQLLRPMTILKTYRLIVPPE